MPVADIKTWLDFAIQQMAAEAYLDQFAVQGRELRLVLRDGNNDIRKVGEDQFAGQTRFVDLVGIPTASHITGSAQAFVSRYQIIDHHANDATGFSATLMRDTQTGEYTLSFRSLEYQNHAQGGHWERDGMGGAAGEIAGSGFAVGQLVSMERYFSDLQQGKLTNGAIDPALQAFFATQSNKINASGYSLGGHLATIFTVLHESRVNHTYIFNGAGIGQVGGVTPVLTEDIRIQQLIDAMDAKFVEFDPSGTLTRSGAPANVQTLPWYQPAVIEVAAQFQTTGTASMPTGGLNGGVTRTDGAFNKITQLFGSSVTGGDLQVVANSGVHGPIQSILIEGQPLLEGLPNPFRDYGNAHSITLIVDSLALQELFQTIDSALTQTQIETILKAASAAQADRFATPGEEHTAEGDTLEKALDGLRNVFIDAEAPSTGFNDDTGGFGNLTFRNEFYTHLAEVRTQLATTFAGQTFQIRSLVGQPVNDIRTAAEGTEPTSFAYRFALKELTPFVVLGSTDPTTQVLYDRQNATGELSLVNPDTGIGEFTPQFLIDRTLFLAEKIAVNSNAASLFNTTHFHDNPSGYDITPLPGLTRRQLLFGDGTHEIMTGGTGSDHFYGGSGDDQLSGLENRDYLEGNRGDDTLDGGSGADTMLGGQGNDTYLVDNVGDVVREYANSGIDLVRSSVTFTLDSQVENLTLTGTEAIDGSGNELDNLITGNDGINRLDGKGGTDHLIGGDKNDILIGGTGDNDLLEGGAGFDTYIYNAGDGIDQIEDSDATGKIVFNGGLLQGGISTDGGDTYVSLDGTETYVLSGGHLIVNGLLTVNANFQSGQFGIQLKDLSGVQSDPGAPTGPFPIGDANFGDADADYFFLLGNPFGPEALYGNGGDDALNAWATSADITDLLDGGPGDDTLIGGAGRDYLIGGEGADFGNLTNGDIFLGGDGNDIAMGDTTISNFVVTNIGNGAYYADGGDGADTLLGALGGDVLHGGDGSDTLRGENRPEGWTARIVGFDGFYQDFSMAAYFSSTGAADVLFGEAGNDLLVGDGGDDILSGGADNDQLFGDDETGYLVVPGDDILDGGAGDDLLAAGDGADSLSGGVGIDTLFGDKGDDVLDGGDDADTMLGGDGADELFGGGGNDLLFGDGLNNQFVAGTVGGDDFLDGGDGDDELQGGVGADMLSGGAGNDFLLGQDDDDTIFGDEGDDELQGGDGIDLLGGDAGDDLLLGDAGDDELFGDTGDDQLGGNDGNDLLLGGVGNDILEGGKGKDVLIGGAGNDVYNFSLGDGQDTITDTALAGEGNVINFSPGITLNSLTFNHDQATQTLTIQVGGGADSIRLLGFDPHTFNYVVDTLRFADGSFVALADQLPLPGGLIEGTDEREVIRAGSTDDTIFAGAGNDVVNAGVGNDVILGQGGNDFLTGGVGQDRYVFNIGDGMDRISDTAGEGNRLVFGPGISANSITLGLDTGDSLSVRIGVAGDAIQILDSLEVGAPSIDSIEFADGATLSIEELLARGIEIIGTAGPDTLTGTNLIDRISGGAGDDVIVGGLGADILRGEEESDQLFGSDGDDRLDGGAGADVLNGEAGQDTYVFGRGYGQDILQDSPVEQSGPNTIQLTSGVSPNEVRLQARLSEDGINVVLTIDGTEDELTLLGAADPSLLLISQILFADGTSWDTAEILIRIEGLRLTAAPAGSSLEGTGFRDELIGAQGNDELDGRGGADRMVGGAGDDFYWVESPGDTVVELEGEGTDTVLSQIDYTLSEHVENLFLRSANLPAMDPIRGEGNASDNLLLGNFGNNVLIGGGGNDVFWGGFSIGSDYGPGNDDLYGGAGNDTYVVEGAFNGFDTVHDVALPGEGNRLQFGNNIRPEDVLFVQEGSFLRITNAGGTDGAVLTDFNPSGITGSLVTEVIAFSSGVEDVTGGYETHVLALMNPTLGTDNTDTLTGTLNAEVIKAQGGDDVIVGGVGNDVLLGGTGNDTYLFNQGDGFDLIDDQPGAGDTNTVQLGAGITPEMLRVSYSGTFGMGGLTVRIGTSGDGLHFLGVSSEDPTEPHAVDTFHFADGMQLTFAQLFEHEVLVQGTGRSDGELFGTFADDHMLGLSGSEALGAGDGNDMLIGGAGNDVLDGGRGSDTYVFNLGDGFDEIRDDAGEQGSFDVNRLQFGTGITASDLTLFNVGDGFTVSRIEIGTAGDAIVLPNFIGYLPALRVAEFADGVTLDLYQLHAANRRTDHQTIIGGDGAVVLIGGSGNDTILAGSETTTLLGGGGHDTVIGGGGTNLLMGGRGNDLLRGGDGIDTYLFNLGDGHDTIEDNSILGEGNRIRFGTGISQSVLSFTHDQAARTLTIQVGSSGEDKLVLTSFDPTGAHGSLVVAMLAFADGSTAQLADLLGGPVNHAPTVATPLADQTVSEDAPFSLVMPANMFADQDAADVLTLSASLADGTALPAWLTFDATTRTFSGIPDDAQVGTLDLRVVATDTGNLSASDVFTLTVTNVNEAPTVAVPIADQQTTEDAPFSLVVPTGTFADVDAGDQLTYSATLANGSTLPSWLSFNGATLTFTGMPLNSDVTTLNVAVTAIDLGGLSATDTFALAIQNVNDAPTVAAPLIDQTVLEGAPFSIQVPANAFADEDADDVLSYSATLANGSALLTWLSFNATTRTFTGTPDDAQVGSLDLRVTATDRGNLSVSDVLTLTVANVNDAPIVVAPLADQQAMQGTGFSFVVPVTTFADEDAGDVLTYSATLANGASLPSWLSFNSVTRTFNGMPLVGDVGAIDVRVTATDQGNLNAADVFALTIVPSSGTVGNDILIGTSGNDVLDGLAGDDILRGLAGNDTLIGGAGNDLLDGGLGADSMTGGTGSDTYVVSTGDTVVEAANAGTDTVLSNVSYTLAANVELLVLTGTNAINGTGNSLANGITGNAAANVLDGGASADVLAGLDGNDTYLVDNAGDLVVELANNGIDTVQSSVTFTLGANVESLTLTGTTAINGTGNGSANVMIGNSAGNVLNGAGGADTLRGGLGNDTVNGGSGNDTFLFGRGDGQDLVQDNSGTADKLLYDAGINPLDLVISRQANNLRLSIHGSTDHVTIQNWYTSSANRTETIQAGNVQMMLSTQVDQLLQAMAGFTQQTGLTWDQAIDQRPQDVQTVLAASWQ